MKTSEMIKKLQESLEENGDVEIRLWDSRASADYVATKVYFNDFDNSLRID